MGGLLFQAVTFLSVVPLSQMSDKVTQRLLKLVTRRHSRFQLGVFLGEVAIQPIRRECQAKHHHAATYPKRHLPTQTIQACRLSSGRKCAVMANSAPVLPPSQPKDR